MRPGQVMNADEQRAFRLGCRSFERGEVDAALVQFEHLLRSREGLADVHYRVGVIHERKNDLAAAAHSLWKALRINPTYAEAIRLFDTSTIGSPLCGNNPSPPFEKGGTEGFPSSDPEIARTITSITPSISFGTWRSSKRSTRRPWDARKVSLCKSQAACSLSICWEPSTSTTILAFGAQKSTM